MNLAVEQGNSESVRTFETRFAEYVGVKYAVAASLGRTALLVLFRALNLQENDEVIVPAFTCDVVPNAVLRAGGVPVFVDLEADSYHMSLAHLAALLSNKTRAVVACHTFGEPEDIAAIRRVVSGRDIFVVEDAAHALGARYKQRRVGSLGDAAIFSLTKNMFNVGGGVIATDNAAIASRARDLLTNARPSSFLTRVQIASTAYLEGRRVCSPLSNWALGCLGLVSRHLGFVKKGYVDNLKIPNTLAMAKWEAKLGLAGLRDLDAKNGRRNQCRSLLDNSLADAPGIRGTVRCEEANPVCTWYAIRLKEHQSRDRVTEQLRKSHVYLYPIWDPVPVATKDYGAGQDAASVPSAVAAARSTLVFKMDHRLPDKVVDKIGRTVRSALMEI